MKTELFFKRSKIDYLIPILLFIVSLMLYSTNLENQAWHGDEVNYLGGSVYFNLLAEGDLSNPCWYSLEDCSLLYSFEWGWNLNSGITRNLFVGLGQTITFGANEGDFYQWSCYWQLCWDEKFKPTAEDFFGGRIFSPILGSLTVVFAFFIGKITFNRQIGLYFSIILLFNILWFWSSRTFMTELFSGFFIFLTFLLLFYSFKKKDKIRLKYFAFSAIVFGLGINTKFTVLALIIIISLIIILRIPQLQDFKVLRKRKWQKEAGLLLSMYFIILFATIFISQPGSFHDPFYTVSSMSGDAGNFRFITFPSLENDNLFRTLATVHSTIFPYFVNYYELPSNDISALSFDWNSPGTYSSIPVSTFFIIGLIYIFKKDTSSNFRFSKIFMIIWFASIFVFTSLIVNEFRMERYFLPLLFPIMLISSYGLWRFLEKSNNKVKLFFSIIFIFSHLITTLVFWKFIYFSYEQRWGNPLFISLQTSLSNEIVIVSSLLFEVVFIAMIFFKIRQRKVNVHV